MTERYNGLNRYVIVRIGFLLEGSSDYTYLEHNDDLILDFRILEEISTDSNNVIGNMSANQLEMSLNNLDFIFSPYNYESEFYEKMIPGTPIKISIASRNLDSSDAVIWDDFQIFYLQDFQFDLASNQVDILAYDAMYYMFHSTPRLRVVVHSLRREEIFDIIFNYSNGVLGQFMSRYGLSYNYGPISNQVFDSLTLQFFDFFVRAPVTIKDVLESLFGAMLTHCYIDRNNVLQLKHFNALTEEYQGYEHQIDLDDSLIFSANMSYSIIDISNGIDWTYDNILDNMPDQVSSPIYTSTATIPANSTISIHVTFTEEQYYYSQILQFTVTEGDHLDYIRWEVSDVTLEGCNLTITNGFSDDQAISYSLESVRIQYNRINYTESVDDPIVINYDKARYSNFTNAQRSYFINFYNAYTSTRYQEMTLECRGDIEYTLGDLVYYNSIRFSAEFYGYIKRIEWDYSGGLTCTLTLVIFTIIFNHNLGNYPHDTNFPSNINYPIEP